MKITELVEKRSNRIWMIDFAKNELAEVEREMKDIVLNTPELHYAVKIDWKLLERKVMEEEEGYTKGLC